MDPDLKLCEKLGHGLMELRRYARENIISIFISCKELECMDIIVEDERRDMKAHQESVPEFIRNEPTGIKERDDQASRHPQKLHLKYLSKSGATRHYRAHARSWSE